MIGPHGLLRALPIESGQAASLTVIRESSPLGAGARKTISVDHEDVLGLGNGEHATIQIPAGERLIEASCHGGGAGKYVRLRAEAGRHYYVTTRSAFMCLPPVLIDEADAVRVMEQTERLLLKP